jgi:hypothetical protein
MDQYEYEGICFEREDDGREYTPEDLGFVAPEIEHDVAPPETRRGYVRKAPEPLIEGDFVRSFAELPDSARNTAIGRLAAVVSERLEFPEASTYLALLASASSAVACAYSTQYRTHTAVALGMYAIIEQPPATKKSYLLSIGGNPYAMAIGEHNKRVFAKNREFREREIEKEKWLKPGFAVTTDATSASLDGRLSACSEGRFVVASAEQSALTSLFPESGTYSSNNELILKGYAGEYVNGMRAGREAFSGEVQGSIILIAQSGSCRRVIAASNGTGMAERFFFMAEPSLLGSRELKGEYPSNTEKAPFEEACRRCVELYSDRVLAMAGQDQYEVLDPAKLNKVRPSASGYNLILDRIRSQEAYLGELNEKGEVIAAGWFGKYETHVLKVAGVSHVIESLAGGCYPGEIIGDSTIQMAMDVVDMLGDQLTDILHDAGESGSEAEGDALIDILSQKPLSKRELLLKAKNRKPYRNMGRNAYASAAARLEAMIAAGVLVIGTRGRIEVV